MYLQASAAIDCDNVKPPANEIFIMSPVNSKTACTVALFCLGLTTHMQAQASTTFANDATQAELIENFADMSDVLTSDADKGEASYNIEDCQALLDEADGVAEGNSKDGGSGTAGGDVKKLDLDKCRSMKK